MTYYIAISSDATQSVIDIDSVCGATNLKNALDSPDRPLVVRAATTAEARTVFCRDGTGKRAVEQERGFKGLWGKDGVTPSFRVGQGARARSFHG